MMKQKVVSKLLVFVTIISFLFLASCSSNKITTPDNNGIDVPPVVDDGDNNNDNEDNGGNGDNNGDGNETPEVPTPDPDPEPQPPVFVPEYPNDPGESYGNVLKVVTPYISLDNQWGSEWKVREKDYKRMSFIWGQILRSFEGDSQGLGIAFGAALSTGNSVWANHADLKYATPDTARLYQTVNTNKNYDLKQPFHKYSQDDNTHKFQADHTCKFFKYGVLVKITADDGLGNTSWTGKYTIGGVYNSPTRLAYGGEKYYHTAESKDDEIFVIRKDLPSWSYNGKTYYKIQLLFNAQNNGISDTIRQDKIWQYSDFNRGGNQRPQISEYIYATKGGNVVPLKRR